MPVLPIDQAQWERVFAYEKNDLQCPGCFGEEVREWEYGEPSDIAKAQPVKFAAALMEPCAKSYESVL